MTDPDLLAEYVSKGVISLNGARQELNMLPISFGFSNWPLNIPPAKPLKRSCSYCKAESGPGNCKNCGAPQ